MCRRYPAACSVLVYTALAVTGALAAHSHQVFKCQVAGTTVFQDVPCPAAPPPATVTSIDARSAAITDAINRKLLLIGMQPKDVVMAWGQPVHIEHPDGRGGSRQQWRYDRGIVYLKKDAVVDIRLN